MTAKVRQTPMIDRQSCTFDHSQLGSLIAWTHIRWSLVRVQPAPRKWLGEIQRIGVLVVTGQSFRHGDQGSAVAHVIAVGWRGS